MYQVSGSPPAARPQLSVIRADYGTEEIADHALALALSMRRGVLLHHDLQRGLSPAPWAHIDHPLVARLQGNTFGILGLGRIGTAAALRAKAFGWKVLFYDPYLPNGADKALGIERTKDIKELYRRSTTLSIHCPHTRETRNSVTYEQLKLMPKGSVLVNTARGEIVDLDGVERCLKEGILAGAALDVLPVEPIPEDNVHPLIKAYREKEEWLIGRGWRCGVSCGTKRHADPIVRHSKQAWSSPATQPSSVRRPSTRSD